MGLDVRYGLKAAQETHTVRIPHLDWPEDAPESSENVLGLTARQVSYGDIMKQVRGRWRNAQVHTPVVGLEEFFSKLIAFWDLDHDQAGALAGIDQLRAIEVVRVISGLAKLDSTDRRDRMVELFAIRKLLAGLFRSKEVERRWLRAPNEGLDGSTPLQVMMSNFVGLLRVRQFLESAAGI